MTDKLSERLEALAALRRVAPLHSEAATEAAWLEEAAELARRFEGAPKVEITECNQIKGAKDFDYGDMVAASQKFDAGQYVRLVPEPQEAE